MQRSLVLSLGGHERPFHELDEDFAVLLGWAADETVEFLVLRDRASGAFIQAAGAHGSVTVEWQQREGDSRRHLRLCRAGLGEAGKQRRPPRVAGYSGYQERELLSVADAVAAFEAFRAGKPVPPQLEVQDISAELGLV